MFRASKQKPTTYKELKKLYVGIIKNITCADIISSKQIGKSKDGKRKDYAYTLDSSLIEYHLELNKYMNRNALHFHTAFVERFGIDVKHPGECDFIDECLGF